jgi:hypothetical protein
LLDTHLTLGTPSTEYTLCKAAAGFTSNVAGRSPLSPSGEDGNLSNIAIVLMFGINIDIL